MTNIFSHWRRNATYVTFWYSDYLSALFYMNSLFKTQGAIDFIDRRMPKSSQPSWGFGGSLNIKPMQDNYGIREDHLSLVKQFSILWGWTEVVYCMCVWLEQKIQPTVFPTSEQHSKQLAKINWNIHIKKMGLEFF